MDFELWKVRITGFLYEFATVIVVTILGAVITFLSGSEFAALVQSHFGADSAITMMIMFAVAGIVKHFRNKAVLGRAQKLGASGDTSRPFHLI